MNCDPPDRPHDLPWEPKALSVAHLKRIATTPVELDSIPDEDLLEATPYGMAIHDGVEYIATWLVSASHGPRTSLGKFIERTDFDSLIPMREFLKPLPDDTTSLDETG